MIDFNQLVAAHEARLASLDPLLRRTHPFPDPASDEVVLATDGGLALLRRDRPDPDSFIATWSAAEQYRLSLRIADPAALTGLLSQCRHRVLPLVGDDPDTQVDLTWPSRDSATTLTLLDHGLVPGAVIAARPAGRATPAGRSAVTVRPLSAGDLAAAEQLWLDEVRWDAQFGTAIERPSTAAAIDQELRSLVDGQPEWTWIAEYAGQVAGLLVVQPPERAEWVAKLTCASPVAYLTCLVVGASQRGSGIGAALVETAHAALDAAGVEVTLLHYAALNPLSGPFWHRCGYRPLWTMWQARPAARLRSPVTT